MLSEEPKGAPPGIVVRGRFLSKYSLERSSGEHPHASLRISAREARGQPRRRYFPDPLAQPDRQEQHGNGKDDADDAVEARGGPLRLMIEMGNRSEWHFLNASRCLEAIRSPQSLEGRGLA